MKKNLAFFLVSILASSVTIATPKTTVNGVIDFSSATRLQENIPNKNLSANNNFIVFNTSANITTTIEAQANNLKYGAKIVCLTTMAPKKTPGFNGSHLYLESDDFGKIEIGAPFDVNTNMQIDVSGVAAASKGSSWYSILDKNPNKAYEFDFNVFDFYIAGFTSNNFGALDREPSRKVNYYTPKINGFQFGVTYIPDTTNGGSNDKTESTSYSNRVVKYLETRSGELKKYNIRYGATNAFAFGVSYEKQIAEATTIKIALTGEFGKALQEAYADEGDTIDPAAVDKVIDKQGTLTNDYRIKDLAAFNIGAQLNQGNFGFAVTYGNLLQSFTSKALDPEKKDTYFYGAAISYSFDSIVTSVTYLGGNNKGNIFNSIALGSDYTLAPGLISYFEAAYAQGKGQGRFAEDKKEDINMKDQKFSGTSLILGLKLNF